jgi:hypothetical protein
MLAGFGQCQSNSALSGPMRAALVPFIWLAALGFALSVAAHVASIAGIPLPGGQSIWLLHIGIFVVWIPTVLISGKVMRGERRRDFWKIVLSGCPPWMLVLGYALFGYVFLNFFYFMATSSGHGHYTGDPPPSVIRGFSGHWMLFYGVAFMTLYSVKRKPGLLGQATCSNGHAVSSADRFCRVCGATLLREREGV